MENSDNKVMAPDDHKKNLPFTGHLTGNQTSHGLAISTNDEMHWCSDMDYHLAWYFICKIFFFVFHHLIKTILF